MQINGTTNLPFLPLFNHSRIARQYYCECYDYGRCHSFQVMHHESVWRGEYLAPFQAWVVEQF